MSTLLFQMIAGRLPLVIARFVAWVIALGAVSVVILSYGSLPDTLPVTRWTTAPKSPLIALRIPLINLLTLGVLDLLSGALVRAKHFERSEAVAAILFLTAAGKAGIEATAILMLPVPFSWTLMPLVAVLTAGLCAAAILGRDFLDPKRWRNLQWTPLETIGALALVSGIVALNSPLLVW